MALNSRQGTPELVHHSDHGVQYAFLAYTDVLKEHGIRFYAGIPLLAPNGQPIGSLCLMDMKPRELSDREKRLLQEYASEVMEEIAKRAPQSLAPVAPPTG